MFTRQFDRRMYIFLGTIFISFIIGGAFGTFTLWPSNRARGYEPIQPISYSHKLHAGDLKIDCKYCHTGVETMHNALIPSLSTCMKCHSQVQSKDKKGRIKRDTEQLLMNWELQEPVLWEKVHDIADFVYFDHSRHTASDIDCQQCHGVIEEMERVKRKHSLKMNWCLDCHRKKPDENSEMEQYQASIYCSTCHR